MPVRLDLLAYDGIEPIDIGATFGVLSMARRVVPDLEFAVIAPGGGAVAMANGLTLMAQRGLDDPAPTPDALVVLGGPGWEAASRDTAILDAVRNARTAGSVVASVCTGAMILAAAGLLDGRPATTKREIMPGETRPLDLLAARDGVAAREARVVDDGDVVTGGGVSLGHDLTLHLIGRFCGAEAAAETARILDYRAAWAANAAALPDEVRPAAPA